MTASLYVRVVPLLLAANTHIAQGQFLRIVPVVPAVALPIAPLVSGYLRVTTTTQLAPLASASADLVKPCPFRVFCGDYPFELVAVTVTIAPGGAESAEFPIAVFDVKNRMETNLAAAQLGRVQFLSIAPGAAQSFLTFQIRAVPVTLAAAFRTGLTEIDKLVASPLVSSFVPVAGQVTAATKLLESFLGPSTQDHPEWKSELRVGLTPGPLQVIPLDGRISILMLRPMYSNAPVPNYDDLERCAASPTEICRKATHQPYRDLPYFMLQADVLPYRELEGSNIGCAATRDEVNQFAELVHQAKLTANQRQLEEALIDRFRLVLAVADRALDADASAADLAFRWSRRDDGLSGNPLWAANGLPRATSYDQCFRGAVTSRGITAARRWDIYEAAFTVAATWRQSLAEQDRVAQLERYLESILNPITAFGLSDGSAYSLLKDEQSRIEAQLVPSDKVTIQSIPAAADLNALRQARIQLELRRTSTHCERCRDILTIAIGQVDTRIAVAEKASAAAVATVAAATAEKSGLADAQAQAKQVAIVAENIAPAADASPANVAGLKRQVESAADVLKSRSATAEQVRQLTATIRQSVDSARTEVRSKPQTP